MKGKNGYAQAPVKDTPSSAWIWVWARAVTKLHGAFKVQFLCAQRGARVFLNISAKFWRNSRLP